MRITGKATDGPVSRHINRKLSTRITGFIVRHGIPITPNQVSLLSFLIGAAALPAYLLGPEWLGGLLVQTSSIVDGVDGELARARGVSSPLGGFVDAILDRMADALIIAGIAVHSFPDWGFLSLAAGLAALFGDIMVSYLHARGEASLGVHPASVGRVPMFASRDVRLFTVFLLSLAGLSFYSLWLLAAISILYVLAKTVDIYVAMRGREEKPASRK